MNEVIYHVKVGEPFDRDQHGHVRLIRERTRFSGLPRELHVPLGGGDPTGPAHVAEEQATFRPTVLMKRVSRAVEGTPGLLTRSIREAVKGANKSKDYALELLVLEGYVEARKDGTATRHHSLRPYREGGRGGAGRATEPRRSRRTVPGACRRHMRGPCRT